MADYHNFVVTTHPFKVEDEEAFKRDLESLGVEPVDAWCSGLHYDQNPDGTFWLGGYDVYLIQYEPDGEEIDVTKIIQKHIRADDYAVFKIAGHEALRSVTGDVAVVTKKKILWKSLDEVANELLREALPREPASPRKTP